MFGEPEDLESACNARLFSADNYGDGSATIRCQLSPGHDGVHREQFECGLPPTTHNRAPTTPNTESTPMPITPAQAREARSTAASPAVADLVERIDAYLSATRSTLNHEWFFAIAGATDDAVEDVIKLYESAGWRVRRIYDREGHALVFSEGVGR